MFVLLFPLDAYSFDNRGISNFMYPGTGASTQGAFLLDSGTGPTCPLPVYGVDSPRVAGTGKDGITLPFSLEYLMNTPSMNYGGFYSGYSGNYISEGQTVDAEFSCTWADIANTNTGATDAARQPTGGCKNIPMVRGTNGLIAPRHGTYVNVVSGVAQHLKYQFQTNGHTGATVYPFLTLCGPDTTDPSTVVFQDTGTHANSPAACTPTNPCEIGYQIIKVKDQRDGGSSQPIEGKSGMIGTGYAGAPIADANRATCWFDTRWDDNMDGPDQNANVPECYGTNCGSMKEGTWIGNLQENTITRGVWRYANRLPTITTAPALQGDGSMSAGEGYATAGYLMKSDTSVQTVQSVWMDKAQKYGIRYALYNESAGDFHGISLNVMDSAGANTGSDEGVVAFARRFWDYHPSQSGKSRSGRFKTVVTDDLYHQCANDIKVANPNAAATLTLAKNGLDRIAPTECSKLRIAYDANVDYPAKTAYVRYGIERMIVFEDAVPDIMYYQRQNVDGVDKGRTTQAFNASGSVHANNPTFLLGQDSGNNQFGTAAKISKQNHSLNPSMDPNTRNAFNPFDGIQYAYPKGICCTGGAFGSDCPTTGTSCPVPNSDFYRKWDGVGTPDPDEVIGFHCTRVKVV